MPSLVHDGINIIDSAVIIEYLDEAFPDIAPFRPEGLANIATMRTCLSCGRKSRSDRVAAPCDVHA